MRYIYIIATVLLFSCSRKQPFAELKDKDLLIQAGSTGLLSDAKGFEYKVRVFPEFKNIKMEEKSLREKMMYHIDSCFYIMNNLEKQYPEGVVPVANGLKNCFEYVVIFPGTKQAAKSMNILTYEDKYINKKTYQLILK